jgi:protein phosphatase
MIKLSSAMATDPGLSREENQDYVWDQVYQPPDAEPVGLFIVCDGIGGYRGSNHVSRWAVEALKSELAPLFSSDALRQAFSEHRREKAPNPRAAAAEPGSDMDELVSLVRLAMQNSNRKVHGFTQASLFVNGESGTTVTMAVVVGSRVVIANVGDSRTYLLRDGKLRQVTKDHSLVASLVANGHLKNAQVFDHPQRNIILRSLGQESEIQVDTFAESLQPGDHLVLCSDGLWESVRDEDFFSSLVVGSKDPSQACRLLVEAAIEAGGQDNISVVVVKAT